MFIEIKPDALGKTPFAYFGKDWALLSAENAKGKINAMTISWGGMGVLWNKNVFFCFIRPTRHTYAFAWEADRISLCFFDEKYREKLSFCGSVSGKDTDKIAECGFTPIKSGGIYYAECDTAIIGRKIYADEIKKDKFIDTDPSAWYKEDYHTLFVCEIEKILRKKAG